MRNENLIRALAGVMVLLPNTAAAVAGLELTPSENFVLLVLAAVGAAILSELKPSTRTALTDEDRKRIAAEQERLRMERVRKVNEAKVIR